MSSSLLVSCLLSSNRAVLKLVSKKLPFTAGANAWLSSTLKRVFRISACCWVLFAIGHLNGVPSTQPWPVLVCVRLLNWHEPGAICFVRACYKSTLNSGLGSKRGPGIPPTAFCESVASFDATRSAGFPTYSSQISCATDAGGKCPSFHPRVHAPQGKGWHTTSCLQRSGRSMDGRFGMEEELMVTSSLVSTVLQATGNFVYEFAVVRGRVCVDNKRRVSRTKKPDWHRDNRSFCLGRCAFSSFVEEIGMWMRPTRVQQRRVEQILVVW